MLIEVNCLLRIPVWLFWPVRPFWSHWGWHEKHRNTENIADLPCIPIHHRYSPMRLQIQPEWKEEWKLLKRDAPDPHDAIAYSCWNSCTPPESKRVSDRHKGWKRLLTTRCAGRRRSSLIEKNKGWEVILRHNWCGRQCLRFTYPRE